MTVCTTARSWFVWEWERGRRWVWPTQYHPLICIMPHAQCSILSALHARRALVMPPQRLIKRFASATVLPGVQNKSTHSEWSMTIQTLSSCFRTWTTSCMPDACLCFKLVHVVENSNSAHWCHTFRWVAEFGVTTAHDLASRIDCSSLGLPALTLIFVHWILQLKLECWIWGRLKYLNWN